MSGILHCTNSEAFKKIIDKSHAVIDFSAKWCKYYLKIELSKITSQNFPEIDSIQELLQLFTYNFLFEQEYQSIVWQFLTNFSHFFLKCSYLLVKKLFKKKR